MQKTRIGDSAVWNLDHSRASFARDSLTFAVELAHPERGLLEPVFQGNRLNDISLFQLSPHPPAAPAGETIIDAYTRGADLVVTYAQTPFRSARPQLVWRGIRPRKGIAGIELIISMQTSLLASNPRVSLASRWPTAEVCLPTAAGNWVAAGAAETDVSADLPGVFLFRPPAAEFTYAEIIFPTDFCGATASGGVLRYQLFPDSLEKGVIRRARLQGVWLPREDDEALAMACHERLLAAAPPLTT